jgi:hypothetical protein
LHSQYYHWQVSGNYQAFLLHQALYDFLRDEHLLPAKGGTHPPVAIAMVITLEDFGDGQTYLSVFVRSLQTGTMIKVRTACEIKLNEEFRQRVS